MLDKRFRNDGKPSIPLNSLQKKYKKIIEKNILNSVLEYPNCNVCNSNSFKLLSEKDRYGLKVSVVICKRCGLIQLSPRMTQEFYNSFYDNEYRKLYSENKIFFEEQKEKGKNIINYIEKNIGTEIKDMFILEVGSSSGGILSAFKEKNNKVLGIDLGSEHIEFANSKGIDSKVGSINDLKLKEKPDIVIYSQVTEHILNPIEEFQNLKKFLKPESLVFIEVPGIKNLQYAYHLDFLKYIQNAHIYYFTLNSLNNCMKKAGYKLISGNERIRTIFKIGEIDDYKDDYSQTMNFLIDLEGRKKNISFKLKNRIIYTIEYLATKTGTYRILEKFQKLK